MGGSVEIVRQLQQFFQPYRMIFKKFGGGGGGDRSSFNHNVSEKTLKNITLFFFGGGAVNYLRIFASRVGGGWNLIKAGGRVFSRILYG